MNFDDTMMEVSLAEGWADGKYSEEEIKLICEERNFSFHQVQKWHKQAVEEQ